MKHIIIIILLSIICSEAAAQDWVSTGGPGGNGIYQIIYNNKKDIFVSAGTLLRSTDAGQSWEKIVPPDAQDGSYWLIAIAANQDIYITGWSDSDKIWKSSDNGDTWNRIWLSNVGNFFTSPDSTIYISTNGNYSFLWRSKKTGIGWDSIPMPPDFFPSGVIDSNGVMIFSSTDGVIRSTDRGMSWSNVLSIKNANYYDNKIACGKKGNIFITMSDLSYYFAFHSTDDGLHWTLIPDFEDYGTFSASPSGKVFFISSRYHAYSDDNGTTWTKCPNTEPLHVYGESVNTDADSGFYIISDGGAATFFSDDPCGKWVCTSIPTGIVEDLICDNDGKIFASVGSATNQIDVPVSIWESEIARINWHFDRTPQNRTGGASQCRGKFAMDSSQNIFYIAGIIYRYDAGEIWDSIAYCYDLDVSRVSSAVSYPDGIWFASSGNGISMSRDSGVTWHFYDPLVRIDGCLTRSRDGILYAGYGPKIFRSEDTDKTWLEFPFPNNEGVGTLIADLYGNVFASCNYPAIIYRSTDQGQTWSEFSDGLTCNNLIHSMIQLPDGSIGAATDRGVFILPLGACQWIPYSSGLWTKDILSLACSKTGELYAGTNGCGVFKSTKLFNDTTSIPFIDPGAINYQTVTIGSISCLNVVLRNKGNKPFTITSFTIVDPIPFSLSSESAKKLPVTINPNDSVIMTVCFHPPQSAVYSSSIIWNTDIDPSLCGISKETRLHGIAVQSSDVSASSESTVFNITPNPIRDKAELHFSLAKDEDVKIECFDLLGRSLKVLAQGNFSGGEHLVTCDLSDVKTGAYIIECMIGNDRYSQPVIILH